MRSRTFQTLGRDAVPESLVAMTQPAATRVTARLRVAGAIVSQMRCSDELLAHERSGDAQGRRAGQASVLTIEGRDPIYLSLLGDDVLAAEPDEVLALLDSRDALYGATVVEKRVIEDPNKELKHLYGYGEDDDWHRSVDGDATRTLAFRAHIRIALCLAADASFAPFASGLHIGVQRQPATLRIDVRTAGKVIWVWASDHRALARALGISRTAANGKVVAFPAFVKAYEWVLRAHLDREIGPAESEATIEQAAHELGRIATIGITEAWIRGRTADGALTTPATRFLAESHPEWVPDEIAEDAEEALARGVSQLMRETLTGRLSGEQTVNALDALAAQHRPGWNSHA